MIWRRLAKLGSVEKTEDNVHLSRRALLTGSVDLSVVTTIWMVHLVGFIDAAIESSLLMDMWSEPQRNFEAKGIKERKMEFVEFKSCEQASIDINMACIPPPDTCVPPEEMEVRTTSAGRVDLRNRAERAVLTPQNANRVEHAKGAEGDGHSSRRGLLQSQITKHATFSRLSHQPKLAVKFKVPQRESCLAPGTGVYYMPRRSITSKGYGRACAVEALSLLADVSCMVRRTHQRSCNLTPKLSENDTYKERFNQTPLQKMASALKKFTRPYSKENYTDQHSKKMTSLLAKENSYKVVRKLRTPRRTSLPAFRCPTKLQKNISLSKCDEIFSQIKTSSSLADTAHLHDRLAMIDTSAITSANKDILGEGRLPDDKSMSNIDSVPLAAQSATTLERVSKSSCQISGTKKKPFRGLKRAERFSNQILHFIGEMTVPERLIRQALGNNPDTSKALRLLLSERKVMRFGTGGRGRAYEYVATEIGLLHIHGVKQAVSEVVELTPESVSSCNPIAGAVIVSDTLISEAQCLPTQDTNSPEASASDTNESRPYSVTSHCSLQWPLAQSLNCVISSQSFDLPSSGITES